MILNISFKVRIPDEQLELAIKEIGYQKIKKHAYQYLEKTVMQTFHQKDVQEVSDIKITIGDLKGENE